MSLEVGEVSHVASDGAFLLQSEEYQHTDKTYILCLKWTYRMIVQIRWVQEIPVFIFTSYTSTIECDRASWKEKG